MKTPESLSVPTEQDLIEWFGSIPVKTAEGQYRFEVEDKTGVKLLFSFDLIQASIQTILITTGNTPLTTVVHEGSGKVWLQKLTDLTRLCAECECEGRKITLIIELEPRIRVEWSSLRI
jgi:hypothetical protein